MFNVDLLLGALFVKCQINKIDETFDKSRERLKEFGVKKVESLYENGYSYEEIVEKIFDHFNLKSVEITFNGKRLFPISTFGLKKGNFYLGRKENEPLELALHSDKGTWLVTRLGEPIVEREIDFYDFIFEVNP